jgi:hypothetical protein
VPFQRLAHCAVLWLKSQESGLTDTIENRLTAIVKNAQAPVYPDTAGIQKVMVIGTETKEILQLIRSLFSERLDVRTYGNKSSIAGPQ